MTASLAEQAEKFANDLTATVRAVVGTECPAFYAVALEQADAFRVRQEPFDGITLCDKGEPILRLTADYKCVLDGHDKWMAISQSLIQVFVEPDGREPLFRYEFDRNISGKVPGAHIHFHGQHPETGSGHARMRRQYRTCEGTQARQAGGLPARSALPGRRSTFPPGTRRHT